MQGDIQSPLANRTNVGYPSIAAAAPPNDGSVGYPSIEAAPLNATPSWFGNRHASSPAQSPASVASSSSNAGSNYAASPVVGGNHQQSRFPGFGTNNGNGVAQSPASPAVGGNGVGIGNLIPNSAPTHFVNQNQRPNYASMMVTPSQLDFSPAAAGAVRAVNPGSGTLSQYAVSENSGSALDKLVASLQQQAETNNLEAKAALARGSASLALGNAAELSEESSKVRADNNRRTVRMIEDLFQLHHSGCQSVPMNAKNQSTFNYNYNPPSNAPPPPSAAAPPSSLAAAAAAPSVAAPPSNPVAARPGVAGPPDEEDDDL